MAWDQTAAMLTQTRTTTGTTASLGSHLAGAMFLAGVLAAVIVLGPIYAIGSLVRRLPFRGGPGVPVMQRTVTPD